MSKSAPHKPAKTRELFSLPVELVAEIKKYADRYRKGNKSGFVADAVDSYIKRLKHEHRRSQLRKSYTAAANDSRAVHHDWDDLDAPWPD